MSEYGIYNDEDLIPYDEIVEECNALNNLLTP